jgi:hypothetical protein
MLSTLTRARGRRARGAAVIAATAALVMVAASSAQSDDFTNDLDASIDPTLETINLTWDPVNSVGTSGSTTISIFIQGHPDDHPGCNIQGGAHYVTVEATSSNELAAVLTNGPTYTFDLCSDTNLVTVSATGVGTSVISFAIDAANTNNNPSLTFTTAGADFQVNVTEGSSPPVGCDADPAAPAWAAAILQKSGYKPGAKQTLNLISRVAQEMTTMARFHGYDKSDHPAYENEVDAYLELITGKDLKTAQEAARPGWVCAPI